MVSTGERLFANLISFVTLTDCKGFHDGVQTCRELRPWLCVLHTRGTISHTHTRTHTHAHKLSTCHQEKWLLTRSVFSRGTFHKYEAPLWPSSCSTGLWLSWQTCTEQTTQPWFRSSWSLTWQMWRIGTSRWWCRCYGGSYRMKRPCWMETSNSPSTKCCT